MKGNKKVTYLLLIVVLGIWGKLLYGFFIIEEDTTSKGTNYTDQSTFKIDVSDSINFKVSSFKRDPFLGVLSNNQLQRKRSAVVNSHRNASTHRSDNNQKLLFPEIEYLGFIQQQNTKKKLLIIRMNGSIEKVREGEQSKEVFFLEAKRDSVKVAYKNERKWLSRRY